MIVYRGVCTAIGLAVIVSSCAEPSSPGGSDVVAERVAADWRVASGECGSFSLEAGWTCFPGGKLEFGAGECRGDTDVWVALEPFSVRHDVVSHEEWASLMPETLNTNVRCTSPNSEQYTCAHWSEALLFANRLSESEGRTACYSFDEAGCRVRPATLSPEEETSVFRCEVPEYVRRVVGCDGYRLPTAAEQEWVFTAAGTFDPGTIPSRTPRLYPVEIPGAVSAPNTWVFDRFVGARHGETDRYLPPGDYTDPVVHEFWRQHVDPLREEERARPVVAISRIDANECDEYTQLLAAGELFADRADVSSFDGWRIRLVRTLTDADLRKPSEDSTESVR